MAIQTNQMKKIQYLNGEKVKIVKDLNIKDENGSWVQIQFCDGKNKGNKKPTILEKLCSK
jgi:hypothetical protein